MAHEFVHVLARVRGHGVRAAGDRDIFGEERFVRERCERADVEGVWVVDRLHDVGLGSDFSALGRSSRGVWRERRAVLVHRASRVFHRAVAVRADATLVRVSHKLFSRERGDEF